MCMCTQKENMRNDGTDLTSQDFDYEFVKREMEKCDTVDGALDLSRRYPIMIRFLPYEMKLSVDVALATGLVVDVK